MSQTEDNRNKRRELPISVLRYRDYRLVWAGQSVSRFGTQMHAIALSWQVYQITGSVALLGLLGLVRAAATMSTSLFGGAIADTTDRKRLLLVTNALLIMLSGGLAIASAVGTVSVIALYAVAAGVAAVSSFDAPARSALIPTLVPRRRIPDAMSINILSGNAAEIAGPAAGGFSVALFGVAGTFGIDAVTFLAVVAAVLLLRADTSAPVRVKRGSVAIIGEGLRFVRETPVIWSVMVLDFGATLLGATISLTPVFADVIFNAGPQGLGLLNAAPAIGAIAAGSVIGLLPAPRRPGTMILASVGSYGLFLTAFGFAPSLWMAMIFLVGYGASDALSMTMRHTIRNLATPNELRGRVAATSSAFSSGGPRLGEFQTGLTASVIGVRATTIVGGIGCVILAGAISIFVPAITSYEFDAEDEEPVARAAN